MDKLLVVAVMIINCTLGAFGAIYLKKGSALIHLKKKDLKDKKEQQHELHSTKNKFYVNVKTLVCSFIQNKKLIIGLILYSIAAILTIILLKYNNLNFIYPLTSASYVFTVLLSSKMLNEKITKMKWLAIILIISGNILITI